MKKNKIFFTAMMTSIIILFGFIGIERMVSDHEVGIVWIPFIKKEPNFQLWFSNPAQKSLEIVEFESLSKIEKEEFINFCRIRFGEKTISNCYKKINARLI
jgi:hypothetical protein